MIPIIVLKSFRHGEQLPFGGLHIYSLSIFGGLNTYHSAVHGCLASSLHSMVFCKSLFFHINDCF
jgi:hypothetical protein